MNNENNNVKLCVSCRRLLPILTFNKDRRRKDGLHCYCKSCKSAKRKESEKQKDSTRIRCKKWYQANKDTAKKRANEWKNNNRERYLHLTREADKNKISRLSDSYILSQLKKLGVAKNCESVPSEIINVFRLIKAIRREAKKDKTP